MHMYLEGVGRNILFCDGAKDLHPLGETLLVQWRLELGQCKVDILLLNCHRALAVVG